MSQPNGGQGFFSVPDFLRHYRIVHNTLREADMESATSMTEPTNFGKIVVNALAAMTKNGGIDQRLLRMYLTMTPSYLVMDTSMNSEGGKTSWRTGFMRLVEVLVALHKRGELELETVNEASKACSECWSISGSWRGLEECKETIREVAAKLKTLLDPNGRTFQGQQIYTPG
ncbi:uncharacterized protein FOMMEDRAFT_21608 [Fomitiporia mediterranea MF3/22]|uniref:uncharacterized protein n=1 Tax=Fomitiporia mediterranea (strain MF3/22) TaxID=694068 RepID=UPI00044072DE|nr:uncharacterized protein FOMMEDRAFT_21608 [Fomitiporia mediterranea MF3/22]EJD01164.1 hypothetical protein FOMMEDRAFT_21608 [Fomitiporia mediterranea MF3/22]